MDSRVSGKGSHVDLNLRVRYAETDRMGVVYYANYLTWFEVGRAEYCRANGFDYVDLERFGYQLVVAEAHCKYRRPARYDEIITVRTWLQDVHRRSVIFRYSVLRKDTGEILVEGKTKHLCVDTESKSRTIPEPYYTCLCESLAS